MRLRFRSAIALVAVIASIIFFSGYSCQKSGLGTLEFNHLRFSEAEFHQKFTSPVPADTYADWWNGITPYEIYSGRTLSIDGKITPPLGTTIPVTMMSIQPMLACPDSAQLLPTTPPVVTFPLGSDLTFSKKLQFFVPYCSSATTSINKIPKGSYLDLGIEFDGNVPADTEISADLSAN